MWEPHSLHITRNNSIFSSEHYFWFNNPSNEENTTKKGVRVGGAVSSALHDDNAPGVDGWWCKTGAVSLSSAAGSHRHRVFVQLGLKFPEFSRVIFPVPFIYFLTVFFAKRKSWGSHEDHRVVIFCWERRRIFMVNGAVKILWLSLTLLSGNKYFRIWTPEVISKLRMNLDSL